MPASKTKSKKSGAKAAAKPRTATASKPPAKTRAQKPAVVRASGIEQHSSRVYLLAVIFSLLTLIFLVLAYYRYS